MKSNPAKLQAMILENHPDMSDFPFVSVRKIESMSNEYDEYAK